MNSLILKDIERYNSKSRNSGSIIKNIHFNSDKTVPEHTLKIKKFLDGNFLDKKIPEVVKPIKKGIKFFTLRKY